MRDRTLHLLLAEEALAGSAPLSEVLRPHEAGTHSAARAASFAAGRGDLVEALRLLGLDEWVARAAGSTPPALPHILRRLRTHPSRAQLTVPLLTTLAYLWLVLVFEVLVAAMLHSRVLPVLEAMSISGPAGLPLFQAASFRDLTAAVPMVASLAAVLLGLLLLHRPDLRALGDARAAAAIAGVLDAGGHAAVQPLLSRQPTLQRAIERRGGAQPMTASEWEGVADALALHALERSAAVVRRVRLGGSLLAVGIALAMAASIYTWLPLLAAVPA